MEYTKIIAKLLRTFNFRVITKAQIITAAKVNGIKLPKKLRISKTVCTNNVSKCFNSWAIHVRRLNDQQRLSNRLNSLGLSEDIKNEILENRINLN